MVRGTRFEDHWPGVGLCSVEGEGHLFDSCLTYCSVVGIAIGYGLDGPGIESLWGLDFSHLSRPGLGPIQPPVQWVPGLSRGQRAPEA